MSPLHSGAFMAHFEHSKASAKQQVNSLIDAIYAKVLLDLELWLNKHESNEAIKSEIDSDCKDNVTEHKLPSDSINWQPTQLEPLQPTHSSTPHYSSLEIEKNKIVVDDGDKEDHQVVDSCMIQQHSYEQSNNDRGYLLAKNEIDDDNNENIGNGDFRELGGHEKFNQFPQNALTQRSSDQQMHLEDDLEFDQEILDEVKREIEEEEEIKRRENEHEGGDERHDEGDRVGSELSEAIDTRATVRDCTRDNSDEPMVIQQEKSDTNNAIEVKIATECTTNPIQANLAQPNRNLQCSLCLKSFERSGDFNRHLRVHTGERPFKCEQCDKRFSRLSSLTSHQLIHQNIKPFQCDQCDKHFRKRRDLTRHQLVHQNIKSFRCNECEKQFTQKRHLDSHLLTHSKGRPFDCRHCEKSFTQMGTRNKHEQAIHLHVKPYRCKQCGHTATQQSDVITHIRMVHFGLPHSIKEQRALNIVDDRDPKELIEKV